jgi:oligopeptide transport system substrate-binding protein
LIAAYKKENPDVLVSMPSCAVSFLICNTDSTALSNSDFRQALSLAIDREALVKKVTLGSEQPAYTFVPNVFTRDYTPQTKIQYNPTLAREKLAASGVTDPKLSIFFESDQSKSVMEAIQSMWHSILGINCKLILHEPKVYLDEMNRGDFTVARSAWTAAFFDPLSMLCLFEKTNLNNKTNWSNDAYNNFLEEARLTNNLEKRQALLEQAEC